MRLETTRKCDLAVQALVLLAPADEPIKTKDLAEALDATRSFMAHVMTPLVTKGWVSSDPGSKGGYRLSTDLGDLSVLEIVETLEGPIDPGLCAMGDRPCDHRSRCAVHDAWTAARKILIAELAATSLADIANQDRLTAKRIGT